MSRNFIPGGVNYFLKPKGGIGFMGAAAANPTEVTQNFNSYAPGVNLSTFPGWTLPFTPSDFITKATGGVVSNQGYQCVAYYRPAGFTTAASHESEVTFQAAAPGAGNVFTGAAVAVQPDGRHYWGAFDNNGNIFLGYSQSGGISFYSYVTVAGGIPAGSKLKVSVVGTGTGRTAVLAYDIGGGWVFPPTLNINFGANGAITPLDGGNAGICGYGNSGLVVIDSLTIRNLPTEVTQDFNSYTAGVSLATLPWWTVHGLFKTVAGGSVWSDQPGYSAAGYSPAGFALAVDHEAEVTLNASAAAAGGGGTAVAFQPNGDCYATWKGDGSYIYFAYHQGGVGVVDTLNVDAGVGIPEGTKLRLSVRGAGATRVCTASYNQGAGWVTPAGWLNRNFGAGKQLDGGKAGIIGGDGYHDIKIDSLTIRNLP